MRVIISAAALALAFSLAAFAQASKTGNGSGVSAVTDSGPSCRASSAPSSAGFVGWLCIPAKYQGYSERPLSAVEPAEQIALREKI